MQDTALPRPFPQKDALYGQYVILEPLSHAHVGDLWLEVQGADSSFAYLRYGPFHSIEALKTLIAELKSREHQPFWGIRDRASGKIHGWLSLCDIAPDDGAIEIGSVWISPKLQRTRQSTECVFLLMCYAMDNLGYHRLVWRCCQQNRASIRTAHRLGFMPEGVWRSAVVVKGRAMDIAWFSMLQGEWKTRRQAIMAWLQPSNFMDNGREITPLTRS